MGKDDTMFQFVRLPHFSLPQVIQPSHTLKFFWYTAQKTQYFASDDSDGNSVYVNLSGIQKSFSPSLWTGDGATMVSSSSDLADDDVSDTGADMFNTGGGKTYEL